MTRQTAIIWVWVFVLIAGAVGGGYAWWRQQDVTQAYEAGRALADSQKWEEVLVLAQPYAERDDPRINGLLADAYINGPDSIKDIDEVLTLRRRATEAGNMRAAYFLGKWILEHEPTEGQAKEGIGFIQAAADCGMPAANYHLGLIYVDGKWLNADYQKSVGYFERSAYSGFNGAAWNTYIVYSLLTKSGSISQGLGYTKSIQWLLVSSKNGEERAKAIAAEVRKKAVAKFGSQGELTYLEIANEADQIFSRIQNMDGLKCNVTDPFYAN